jgi:enterochelin esterase-like enzyme
MDRAQAKRTDAAAGTQPAIGWRYDEAGKRDLRLDLLRGFAVFAMVVDHVGGASWLYALTGGNRFFVSAAEAFVFLSGVLVGIVYGGVAVAQGVRPAVGKLLQRAWVLYAVAVWLTLGFALAAVVLGDPIGAPFAQAPARFIFEVVTLQRTFYLVDVLLVYLFAMLAATGALALLVRGRWRAVALLSGGLWAAFQVWPAARQLPWPIADNPVFPFAAWQLPFFAGLLLGYHRHWLAEHLVARLPASPLRDGYLLPLGAAFAALVWLHATDAAAFDRLAPGGDAAAVLEAWFLKSHLPPPRLLACAVVFAFAWALVTRCWRPVRAASGPLLLALGQGALYAYAAHLFVAALARFVVVELVDPGLYSGFPPLHPGANAALQVAAVAVLWALTRARFLQGIVAPLGRPPFAPARQRLGAWSLPRPAEPLLAILLVALVTMVTLLPQSASARAAGQRATPSAAAPPVSTITAPRSVAGAAAGSGAAVGAAVPPAATTNVRPSAATAAVTPAGGYLRDASFESAALGRTLAYGIYLPPGYDGGATRYPTLYMLHGLGSHYSEWVVYGLAETADRLIQGGRLAPLIIVFPQGDYSYFVNHAGTSNDRWGDATAFDLTAHIDATYRTIPAREGRAIGGLSMGGFGALSLAFAHPYHFGVVGAHSPSLRTQGEAPDYLGSPAEYARIDPMALAYQLDPGTAPRIWIDVGTTDSWAVRTTSLKDLLRARGILPEYRETNGGHGGEYWRMNTPSYLRFYTGALTPAREP